MRRLKRLGLIIGKRGKSARYGKNLHEIRDLFRTRWEKSGASGAAAEFFKGHARALNHFCVKKNDKWASLHMPEFIFNTRRW